MSARVVVVAHLGSEDAAFELAALLTEEPGVPATIARIGSNGWCVIFDGQHERAQAATERARAWVSDRSGRSAGPG